MIERIRFTLAHELGHLFLEHPYSTQNSILSRNSITNLENKTFEIEADFFAKELLAPSFFVNKIVPLEVAEVSKKFEISNESSKYAIENVIKSINYGGLRLNNLNPPIWFSEIFKKFKFTDRKRNLNLVGMTFESENVWYPTYKKIVYCSDCKTIISINSEENHQYCTRCSSSKITEINEKNYFKFHEMEEQNTLNYTTLKVDSEGRLQDKCPICENENLQNNYCSICGVYIINECSGKHDVVYENNYVEEEARPPCDKKLSGADRFCSMCGAKSSFLINGLLKKWEDEPF